MADRPLCVATHKLLSETEALLKPHCRLVANLTDRTLPREEVLERCADADASIVFMPDLVDRAFLERCPDLKIISAALKGYDNIDVEACTERGIWVSIVPDHLTAPTAELAIGLAIGLMRHVAAGDADVRSGRFKGWRPVHYGMGFQGATVGLLGFGRIGMAIARRLQGFGARLTFTDVRAGSVFDAEDLKAAPLPLDRLLSESDIVFVCLPLATSTLELLDADKLALMRPGAFLINPARGSVVDELAVAKALEGGRLGGYAADAFVFEDWARPDRSVNVPDALLAFPERTLFTPHLGSATVDARMMIERCAAENVLAALRGTRPPDAINTPSQPR